jgi:hypothetical protein
LLGKCTLPRAELWDEKAAWWPSQDNGPDKWPEVTFNNLASCQTDCILCDVWEHGDPVVTREYLKEVIFSYPIRSCVDEFVKGQHLIGVHIRYGDYVAVNPMNPPIVQPRFMRAPNSFYTGAVDRALALLPGHSIFLCTDGTADEVKWFTGRYGPIRQPENDGLLDLLTLSRCSLIVGSESTFSEVAAGFGSVPRIVLSTDPNVWDELMLLALKMRPV